jgi:gliding motility-associated lipoprotein GldH
MSIKISTVLYLFSFVFFSCTHTFREYEKKSFGNLVWKEDHKVVFQPVIEDPGKKYHVQVGLRYHIGIQFNAIDVNVNIVSPSGKETSKDYKVVLRDESNKHKGSCAGDLCDLETVVIDSIALDEAGEYKVIVSRAEGGYSIAGVMEVGLIIDEAGTE